MQDVEGLGCLKSTKSSIELFPKDCAGNSGMFDSLRFIMVLCHMYPLSDHL